MFTLALISFGATFIPVVLAAAIKSNAQWEAERYCKRGEIPLRPEPGAKKLEQP